jgi:hypothetical protein
LPVANLRVRDNVSAYDFLLHPAAMNTPFSPRSQRGELRSGRKASTNSTISQGHFRQIHERSYPALPDDGPLMTPTS